MAARQPAEVLFADEFNRPVLQMGPYDAAAMGRNLDLVQAAGGTAAAPDWAGWFGGGGAFTLTASGREAIGLALDELTLSADDEVLIVTTSGGPYVSRCVTEAIEARCGWTRARNERTRAILVIHEFGFPARLEADLAGAGLPVIEDCAYALGLEGAGRLGDYVVWSFSKALPMPYGGLLRSPRPPAGRGLLSDQARREAPILAGHYLAGRQAAFARRREVFELYRARFAEEGFVPLFEPGPGVTPHSFVVALADQARAEAMKPRLQAAGIISSVFYGGGGYFLPCHQGLSAAAVDYVAARFAEAHAWAAGA